MSNPLPDWMEQKIWPQIYGMLLNDAYFKLMCRARELTGTFNGPIAELIQTGYLSFQTDEKSLLISLIILSWPG
jgi:hypothetical protein